MFNQVNITLPGYGKGEYILRELSVRQLREVMKVEGDDLDVLLASLKYALRDKNGKCIVTDSYSIDDLADDLPQSYLNILAEKYAELADIDELSLAKKS